MWYAEEGKKESYNMNIEREPIDHKMVNDHFVSLAKSTPFRCLTTRGAANAMQGLCGSEWFPRDAAFISENHEHLFWEPREGE
jgi:hypothetical protein